MYSVTAPMCIVTTHALGKQLPARGKIITRGASMEPTTARQWNILYWANKCKSCKARGKDKFCVMHGKRVAREFTVGGK